MYVQDDLDILLLSEENAALYNEELQLPPFQMPNDDYGKSRTIHIASLRSVYTAKEGRIRGQHYHLHPEFVETDKAGLEYTFLCASCKTSIDMGGIPKHSIASGVDFGDFRHLGLAAPNLFELALISSIRHYHHVVKIQPNSGHHGSRSDYSRSQMKGHSILFEHDAPKIAALMLMMKSSQSESSQEILRDILTIHFVGPEEDIDRLAKMMSGSSTIIARSYVIYQWLLVLHHTNFLYHADPCLPTFEQLKELIPQWNKTLVESAIQISNTHSFNVEKLIGDDTANVRSKLQETPTPDAEKGRPMPDMSLSFSYVTAPKENRESK
jgi:hypothetical protein